MWSELVQAFLGFARGTLAPLGRHHSKSPTPALRAPLVRISIKNISVYFVTTYHDL